MRDDAPAALPLIGYVTGLVCATQLVAPWRTVAGLIAVALLSRRARSLSLFLAIGVAAGLHQAAATLRDAGTIAAFDPHRFVTIDAPISRDWSPHGGGFAMRVERFRVGNADVDHPLTLYLRSAPPPSAMRERIVAEGFLRRDFTVSVKSARLVGYRGTVGPWTPAALNRFFAMRLDDLASAHPEHADDVALIEALALGRSDRLTEELRDGYKRGGTYHLLVFSGLQIALAAAAIAMLLRWLHAPRLSDWLLLAMSVLAPLFIGATASVSRASLAVGLYAFSRILHRPTTLENLWCVSALLRLLFVPEDLADAAFQLTYAGSGALLFLAKGTKRRWLTGAVSAELAVTPLTLLHFHQFALGGSILTAILAPLILVMLLVSAAACVIPSLPLLTAIGFLNAVCERMNAVGAVCSGIFAAPPLAAVIAGYGGAFVAVAFRRKRLAAALLVVPSLAAIVCHFQAANPSTPHLTMLDVGQGDAHLIRAGGKVLLVDGGGRMDDARFGESTLLPLLADRGVRRVDLVVLTHPHPDHCGGLPAVIRRLEVGEVWISPRRFRGPCAQTMLAACLDRLVPIHLVRDGQHRELGPMRLDVFTAGHTFKRSPENNSSIVLALRMGERTFLLTGDVEREAEALLAPRMPRADVLKIGHHGSRTSSTGVFLDAVQPRVALISCGLGNPFGHPSESVVNTLAGRGVHSWRTDRSGSVDVEVRDGHLFVRPQIDTPR